MNNNYHVLIAKDKNGVVAHCLEMDICGQGKTEDTAVKDLIIAIQEQIIFCSRNKVSVYRPAPKEYWDKFYQSLIAALKSKPVDEKPLSRDIPSHLELAYA
ncbi:MAG: hypothetical protein V2A70_01290 [Candidatus Omnitrophota bacterium]